VVGKYTTVSQYTYLCTATHDYRQLHCPLVTGTMDIGDYAWVCAQAFVMPNVSIGQGTVVGARSVVTRSLPAWIVAAGNPCRVLKRREITQLDLDAA
jgi:putative colanic acid biosynthesis acetyltransferase WcaF